ncbi:hypothetical protein SAPIO_CDS6928 [Scedosporium apiospermum]|uniref:Uncharacterized protein n=1 Tax=Pseudallescheria apiosperma TaxID=563466 RepID=A0A084G322_PSEDA|nr:uncharacterized protein SAPIO_CDS6928 [Scedosporium apiospermum]KEZ41734.1 hypothetical protein SAPIO_CDS6928 [Scedosporium apiospermum]
MAALLFSPFKVIDLMAQQPLLPASALAFLAYGPPNLVRTVLNHPLLQRYVGEQTLKTSLKVFAAIGLIRLMNRVANRRARNNWRLTRQPGWEWSREIAVVTGSCGGIGKCIALGLARKGVHVVILDVQSLPADLAKIDQISYWKCDLASSSAVKDVADEIRRSIGHPSIVVNNAGIAKPHGILETTEDYLLKIFGVNTFALWFTAKEFLPSMVLRNKGHIVTVASIASFSTAPTIVDYAASKAGALAFHEGLSAEIKHGLRAPGIITTVVHPYWTMTGMTSEHADKIKRAQGPLMQPDDVAKEGFEGIPIGSKTS